MLIKRLATVAVVAFGAAALIAGQSSADADGGTQLDPALQSYKKSTDKIEGNLNSIGSDTMNNLLMYWGEEFKRLYPAANIQFEGKGSSTAPPALLEGSAQLGPMSRTMKNEEIDSFEKKYGYKPTHLRTSLDALAVFVHRDNPIKSLSLTQIDSIFSSTRKRGGADVKTWGDLGLTGEWKDRPINIFGRNSASGTYGFFKEHALKKGDYRDTVKEQPGSAGVVQGVAEDRYAIGYSGIGYATSGVRAVPLAVKDGGTAYEAVYTNVVEDNYPLGRYLNLYINKSPSKPLDPLVREFCKFIFSKEGQQVVDKAGFLPLTEKVCVKERTKLE